MPDFKAKPREIPKLPWYLDLCSTNLGVPRNEATVPRGFCDTPKIFQDTDRSLKDILDLSKALGLWDCLVTTHHASGGFPKDSKVYFLSIYIFTPGPRRVRLIGSSAHHDSYIPLPLLQLSLVFSYKHADFGDF